MQAQSPFEELLRQAREDGYTEFADRLDDLMHKTAWTTSSELIGELGLTIKSFLRTKPTTSPEMRRLLKECRKVVRKAWPGL